MENASKALLMAGGILIALLVIALFTYMFTSAGDLFQTDKEIEETEELVKYNQVFESYNRKLLRGTELISLINRSISSNNKYTDAMGVIEEYKITIKFELVEDLKKYQRGQDNNVTVTNISSLKKGITYSIDSENSTGYTSLIQSSQNDIQKAALDDFKRRVFDCTGIKYNSYGRVSELSFKERKIDYSEGF